MFKAARNPSPANLHQWRKRIKYHWYHSRLLRGIWHDALVPHRDAAKELSDLLGDHHDLAVLLQSLFEQPDLFGCPDELDTFVRIIEQKQASLEREAFDLGCKLLAEKKRALARRWNIYWLAWKGDQAPHEIASGV